MELNADTFFFRHLELQFEILIVHVPQLNDPVLPTGSNQVVLIELEVLSLLLLDLVLSRRLVLELSEVYFLVRAVTGLDPHGSVVRESTVPQRRRRTQTHQLIVQSGPIERDSHDAAIETQHLLLLVEEEGGVVDGLLCLRPAVYFSRFIRE